MVEDQEAQDQDGLVDQLTPALHQECRSNFATTMQTIFLGGDFARADRVFHTRCSRHWVLSTDADTVEEKGPDIADDPTVLSDTPCSSEHYETDEHNGGVLDKTPASTKPERIVSPSLSVWAYEP